jgi:hypothetical protein
MASPQVPAGRGGAAFVLGGGGVLGAAEVGMLQALFEDQVRPDLIVGTSVGAINGALVAADPAPSAVDQLRAVWEELASRHIFGGSVLGRMSTLVRTRTQVHPPEPLRHLLEAHLPVQTFAEQQVPFHCVAASIERPPSAGSPRVPWSMPCSARTRSPDCCRRWRSRASTTWPRLGAQHPGRPGGRARCRHHLRAARRSDRPSAAPADPALGGRDGRL